ncbi:histidine phosphatase family protein [Nocardia thailandica]|uniref:Histidine phosphatase family protein n=1 Tax=Nocardia thailandica TaxID=257275 RepID=A0ABW6PK33_9NOCA
MRSVLRVDLIGHGLTAAMRGARFPVDEELDASARTGQSDYLPPADARVVLGPELRVAQTAARFGLSGDTDDRLRDLDAGSWRGAEMGGLAQDQLFAWLTDPDFRGHGGESVTEVIERTRYWLAEVAAAGSDTVAVTHPAVVRSAVVVALDAPPTAFWRIDVAPASVTRLHFRGQWTLRLTG